MSRLVNDLLDVSRISRGKIELRRARVALQPIIEDAIDTMRPLVSGLGHTLEAALPPEPLHVDGDAGRLSQAVGNLLSNAAKFTDNGGVLRLSVSREDDDAVVDIVQLQFVGERGRKVGDLGAEKRRTRADDDLVARQIGR